MEGLAVMGFVFGMVGVVALVRLEKLIKTLKEKGILSKQFSIRSRLFVIIFKHLLSKIIGKTIVFTSTKADANDISQSALADFDAEVMHGDIP